MIVSLKDLGNSMVIVVTYNFTLETKYFEDILKYSKCHTNVFLYIFNPPPPLTQGAQGAFV